MKKLLFFAAMAALCVSSLVSCTEHHDITSYQYRIVLELKYASPDADVQKVSNDLIAVIGSDGCFGKGNLYSPMDSQAKDGCAAVQKKYADNPNSLTSVYMRFSLRKVTITPGVTTSIDGDEIGSYEFGDALVHPYAFYTYSTSIQEATITLQGMKENMDAEVYKECGQTLLGLKTQFSKYFDDPDIAYYPYLQSDENDKIIKDKCDELWAKYADHKNAVSFYISAGRVGLLDKKVVELWRKTFEPNVNVQ